MRRSWAAVGAAIAVTVAVSAPAAAQGQPLDNNVLNLGQCVAGDAIEPRDVSAYSPSVVLFAPPDAHPEEGFTRTPPGRAGDDQVACSTLYFTP